MDPVAAKSSFLCMYMSSHKDTLASYVIYHGKVANIKITNAEMTRIDSQVPITLLKPSVILLSHRFVYVGYGHRIPNPRLR